MSLRKTTIFVVIFTFLGLALVLTLDLERTLVRHFDNDERVTIMRELDRLRGAFDFQSDYLSAIASRWGSSDDAYTFLQDNNPQFAIENLSDQVFVDFKINCLAFVHSNGSLAYSKCYDYEQRSPLETPPDLTAWLAASPTGTERDGVVMLEGGPMMLHVQPVRSTSGLGEPRGALAVGFFLAGEQLQRLETLTTLTLTVSNYDSSQLEPDFARARDALTLDAPSLVEPLSEALVSGYTLIADIDGNPALIVRVDESRRVHQNGLRVMNYLVFALIMASLTFAVMILVMLQQFVFRRLTRLTNDINKIGASGDISAQVVVTGKDELSTLSRKINGMLENLGQAQRRIQESEERFRGMVEALDDVVFTIDADLSQVQMFGQWTQRYHLPPDLFLGNASAEVLDAQAARLHREANQRVLAGEHLVYDWSIEVDGRMRHFQTSLSPMSDAITGKVIGIAGVGRDTTAYKDMEAALRQRVDDLAALYDVSHVLLSQIDVTHTLSRVCQLAVEQFGLLGAWIGAADEPLRSITLIASHSSQPEAFDRLLALVGSGCPSSQALTSDEPVVINDLARLSDGGAYDAAALSAGCRAVAALPLVRSEDQPLGVLTVYSLETGYFTADRLQLLQSITNLAAMALQNSRLYEELNQGRDRLQVISRRLVEVQEGERRQIGLELHDEIGQILTGLKIMLDVEARLASGESQTRLAEAQSLVNDLIQRVRELSLSLRPAMLDDLGLLPALLWHFGRYTHQTGVRVDFRHAGLEGTRMQPEMETTAYRIVQEALTNVARYAAVSQVLVRLWLTDEQLVIQVEDEGHGFDPESVAAGSGGRGIMGMRERAALMGGRFTIESEPGCGTRLTVELPLADRNERSEYAGHNRVSG